MMLSMELIVKHIIIYGGCGLMGCRYFLRCFDCTASRISSFTIFLRILSNNGWQKIHEHCFSSFQVFHYPGRS